MFFLKFFQFEEFLLFSRRVEVSVFLVRVVGFGGRVWSQVREGSWFSLVFVGVLVCVQLVIICFYFYFYFVDMCVFGKFREVILVGDGVYLFVIRSWVLLFVYLDDFIAVGKVSDYDVVVIRLAGQRDVQLLGGQDVNVSWEIGLQLLFDVFDGREGGVEDVQIQLIYLFDYVQEAGVVEVCGYAEGKGFQLFRVCLYLF